MVGLILRRNKVSRDSFGPDECRSVNTGNLERFINMLPREKNRRSCSHDLSWNKNKSVNNSTYFGKVGKLVPI